MDSELYSLLPPSPKDASQAATAATARLSFHPVPPVLDAPDPKALLRLQPPVGAGDPTPAVPGGSAAAAAAVAGGVPGGGGGGGGQGVGLLSGVTSAEELARAVGSSMRLTLTEEVRHDAAPCSCE